MKAKNNRLAVVGLQLLVMGMVSATSFAEDQNPPPPPRFEKCVEADFKGLEKPEKGKKPKIGPKEAHAIIVKNAESLGHTECIAEVKALEEKHANRPR